MRNDQEIGFMRPGSVWAPFAKRVELVHRGERHRLSVDENGWWTGSIDLKAGDDYWFVVDDAGPFPDPRSAWQPEGPHQASRIVDHSAFRWTDRNWQQKPLSAAVIYELHVGTFTPEGTFDGVISKLDHLVDLGVTHIEIMPVAQFHGVHGWGYDGVGLSAPQNSYGGPDAFKRLIDACHAHGIAVILDVVYNHLGPSGNYLSQFGPYFTNRHQTPWGQAINFDGPYSDEVRRYFIDNALMWLRDYHIDGLRLDAVHAIVDLSATHFLEELATEVDELKGSLGRHLVLIAESDLNDPRMVRTWELGGFGMDAQWSDDIHHALHTVLTGEGKGYYSDFGSLEDLATSMTRPYVYAGRHSTFRQRRHGRPAVGLSAHRFVAYLQNHDQLGNRAQGERVCHLVSDDRVKIGAALILLSPYVPMLFQGEEWAASAPFQYFVNFPGEPDLIRAVSEGRRREFAAFGWDPKSIPDPNAAETFARSKLEWSEISKPQHQSMLGWYRELIRLRTHVSSLTTGRLDLVETDLDSREQWLVVERSPVTIVCNFATEPRTVEPRHPLAKLVLASKNGVTVDGRKVSLPAESVAVFGPG
jgi:maltooligosyltrehalose trehalohydrolase